MTWNDILQDEEFQAESADTRRTVARNYFKQRLVNDEFLALPEDEQKEKEELFVSQVGTGDSLGGVGAVFARGGASLAGALGVNIPRYVASTLGDVRGIQPLSPPILTKEEMNQAADWVEEKLGGLDIPPKTGGYLEAPLTTGDPILEAKRFAATVVEGAPIVGAFIVAEMINPWLGFALMMGVEGGEVAQGMIEYERTTGEKIPEWQKKSTVATVGVVNAYLERLGMLSIMGRGMTRLVKGRIVKTLIASGVEGLEEFLQGANQVLAESGYKDPGTAKEILTRLWGEFYGGATIGLALGGIGQVISKAPRGAEDKIVISEEGAPTEGLTAVSANAASSIDLYRVAVQLEHDNPTPEAILSRQGAENALIDTWMKEHPEDPHGVQLNKIVGDVGGPPIGEVLKGVVIKPPKAGEKVSISTEQFARGSVGFEIEPGRVIGVSFTEKTGKTAVERVLTALNVLNKEHNGEVAKWVRSVVVAPGTPSSWFKAVAEHLTENSPEELEAALGEDVLRVVKRLYKDTYAHVMYNADGSMNILMRGSTQLSKIGSKTGRHLYFIEHELEHGRRHRRMTPEEMMKAEERRSIEGRDVEDLEANRAAKDALNKFHAMIVEQPKLEFQKAPEGLEFQKGTGGQPVSRLRLLQGVEGMFKEVVQSTGQLHNSEGAPVNAAVDTDSGVLYLSYDIDSNTVGHEAMETLINRLGESHSLVRQGLDMFNGDKEALSDAVGDYYANTIDAGLVERLGEWLKLMWAEFKNSFGMEVGAEEIVTMLNSRMIGESFRINATGSFNLRDGKTIDWTQRTPDLYSIIYRETDTWKPIKQVFMSEDQLTSLMEIKPLDFQKKIKRYYPPKSARKASSKLWDDIRSIPEVPPPESARKAARRAVVKYEDKKSTDNIIKKMDAVQEGFMRGHIYPMMELGPAQSHEELISRATPLVLDTEVMEGLLDKLEQGVGLNPIEVKAVQIYTNRRRMLMSRSYMSKNPSAAVKQTILDAMFVNEKLWNLNNIRAGQATEGLKMLDQEDYSVLLDIIKKVQRGTLSKKEREEFEEAFEKEDYESISKLVRRYSQAKKTSKWRDLFWWVYYNGILSGKANIKNVLSNTLWLEAQAYQRGIESGVDFFFQGVHNFAQHFIPHLEPRQRTTFLKQALKLWTEIHRPKAVREAGRKARKAWRTGVVPPNLHTKWEMEIGSITGPLERLGMPTKWAKGLSIFTRALVVGDVFFKSIAGDASIQEQIIKEMQLTGKTYSQVSVTSEMLEEAQKFMGYVTFMDKPGALARSASAVRRAINETIPLGRMVIPFVNTWANIFNRAVEITPGVGLLRELGPAGIVRGRRRWGKGEAGPKGEYVKSIVKSQEMIKVMTNQLEGSVVAFVLLGLLNDEDKVTGEAPRNPAERRSFYALGKAPHSFRVGNWWIPYGGVEPFNIVISNIVAFRDAWKDLEDEETKEDAWATLAHTVAANLSRNTYMDNLYRALQGKFGFRQFAARLPASLVPYSGLWRQINRTYEAYQGGERYVRENHEFIAATADCLPWFLSDALGIRPPPKIDALGEEIAIPGGMLKQWAPAEWQKSIDDPVEEELERLGVYPGLPSRNMTISGNEVVLDREFYREYSIYYGSKAKEAIQKVLSLPSYHRIPEEARTKLVGRAVQRSHLKARKLARHIYVQSHPELRGAGR